MALEKHDFVEIDYTGRLKDTNEVFDTTDLDTARKSGIYNKDAIFGSVVVCLGEGFVLQGLENKLIGKEIGEYDVELSAEEGFGKKSTKLIQLVPTSKFTKQNIVPMPGLQIDVDGLLGTIKTVTGGRTIVDFNHPLSGRGLLYKVKIKRVVTDKKEKADAILNWNFRIHNAEVKLEDETLTVAVEKLPKEFQDEIAKKITELANISTVLFEEKKEEKKHTSDS